MIELHGQRIADPYNSLDDTASSGTQAWIAAQEENYQSFVAGYAAKSAAENSLATYLDVPEKGIPTRSGNSYVFYHRGAGDKNPKLVISDTPDGAGRTLVDPAKISPDGRARFGAVSISPDGRYLAYGINHPAMYPDAKFPDWEMQTRIMDLATGKHLPDVLEKSGFTWQWDKDGKGLLYNRVVSTGAGPQDFEMQMMHHRLGEPQSNDSKFGADQQLPYGGPTNSSYGGNFSYNGKQEWYFTGGGADHTQRRMMMKDAETGKYRTIVEEGVAECRPFAETENGILMWTDRDAPKGKVVLCDPADPAPEKWKTIIPEGGEPLQHAFLHDGKIFALNLHDCAHRLSMYDTSGAPIGDVPLPPQTRVEFEHASRPGVSFGRSTPAGSDDLFFRVMSFDQPPAVYRYDAGENVLAAVDAKPENPKASNVIVEQLWATREDGTRIPMTVMRRADVELDGTAALKITGYGAYGSSFLLTFDPQAAAFVDSGGIYAVANIRGGGEFGNDWSDQGRLLNKTNSFDDFNACAQHLADNKYTSAGRIVSYGHSAGGLLVLAAMQRAPEGLYGAVISSCPVANMLGREKKSDDYEFGDPYASKQVFDYNMGYSPLHNIRPDRKYPNLLVREAEHDRLLPGALKFVAEMQHTSPHSLTLLHTEKGFGHGTARPADVAAREYALEKAFIEKSIGPINQADYKRERGLQHSQRPQPAINKG